MKIHCQVCVHDRSLSCTTRQSPKQVQSTLALCRLPKEGQYIILLFSLHNKLGTKYVVNDNISNLLIRFIDDGKMTIQFKEPQHNLLIRGDALQLKSFIHLLRRAISNKLLKNELTLSSLSVTPISTKNAPIKRLKIIENASNAAKPFPRSLEELELINIGYTRIENRILQLNRLKCLDLSNNKLEFLPPELKLLPCLTKLVVAHNNITSVQKNWDWITGCVEKNLEILDISNNSLQYFPHKITYLKRLSILKLSCNAIPSLPEAIGKMKRSLKELSIAHNQLKILPGNIRQLRLSFLDISGNRFEDTRPSSPRNVQQSMSLLNIAAEVVVKAKLKYDATTLPRVLIDYLEEVPFCTGGQPCFRNFSVATRKCYLGVFANSFTSTFNDMVYFNCHFCATGCHFCARARSAWFS